MAAILTFRHKDTLVYKFGCSDARFNNLGGTQFLFWKAIQQANLAGLRVFDLRKWRAIGVSLSRKTLRLDPRRATGGKTVGTIQAPVPRRAAVYSDAAHGTLVGASPTRPNS